jgi:hypothetical protein
MVAFGVFMRNEHIPDGDWAQARRSGAKAILLLATDHAPADAQRAWSELGSDCRVIVRLPNSTTDVLIKGAGRYAAECMLHIGAFYGVGVREFQVDNEPSQQKNWANQGPWGYQQFLTDVLRLIGEQREQYPDLRLICPQLSTEGVTHDGYAMVGDVLAEWMEALAFQVVGQVDAIACPCYWQNWFNIGHGSFGRAYSRFHKWQPDKEILITEYGAPYFQLGLDRASCLHLMRRDYPDFISQVRREAAAYNVTAALMFLGGSLETAGAALLQWQGYLVDQSVEQAMFAAIVGIKVS